MIGKYYNKKIFLKVMDYRFFFFSLILVYVLLNIPGFLSFVFIIGSVTFGARVRFLAELFKMLDEED